ncbi:MAG: dienelactone hydrolase family protein [Bacteroidales bacterium]|nr:dienelactone hydrolase family protein [Bacteroidales bacterium]
MRSYIYFSLSAYTRRIIVVAIILFFSQSISNAQIQTGSFDFDGDQRNYMAYLPDNYNDTLNFPLVIYLHCYGWTAQQGMNYTLLNQVADTSGFIVVSPSAITNWNSGVGDNARWPTPNVNDVGFINALIDTVSSHYGIDPERIYACGYSNGGFMSYKLACQLSDRIAAIASVGGISSTNTVANCNPVRSMPVLQIHGTEDSWVPISGNTGWYSVDQTLSFWTGFNNCVQVDTTILQDLDPTDSCTVEKISYTKCSNNISVIYYKVINGGHTWPGAGPAGYPAGNTNQDFNASVEIWNFFKDIRLNQ